MNRITEYPLMTQKAKRLFTIMMLLFCFLPIILNCVVISPLYTTLFSDVLYSNSLIINILDYTMDFFDVIAFSVSYALIIFSVLLLSKKAARFVMLLYGIAFFLQIPMKILMTIPMSGSLGTPEEILTDIVYLSVYFILFILQMLAVYFFATTDTDKYLKRLEFKNRKKQTETAPSQALPIKKLFSPLNPLQLSALKMSILIFAVRVVSRILSDITYGAPTSFGEIMIMIVYYLSDTLYGVVAYILALLIFTFVYERLADKKADEAQAPSAASII